MHIRWVQGREAENEATSALNQVTSVVAEKAQAQMEAAKAQAVASLRLPELREAEAKAGGGSATLADCSRPAGGRSRPPAETAR